MQTSWRHHYIPQFYLKGFTDENNRIEIYDLSTDRIKSKGPFSTKSHFFEEGRNSWITEDEVTDFLEERLYKNLDDDTAKIFEKIRNSNEKKYGISNYDIALLQYFVSNLYWRIPLRDKKIMNLVINKGLSELGLKIFNKSGESIHDDEFEKKIKSDENFIKSMRYLIPAITYPKLFNCDSPLTILPYSTNFPGLCADNPLILRDPEKDDIYLDDFILPLDRNKILIRSKRKVKGVIDQITKIEIDIIVVMQSIKYACSSKLLYLKQIRELKEKYQKVNINLLRNKIFEDLLE